MQRYSRRDDNNDGRYYKREDLLTSRTEGLHIPPARLLRYQEFSDKSEESFQYFAWKVLKKTIHSHINKLNMSNVGIIARKLLRVNIIRGRGLLVHYVIKAQTAFPISTPVYAAFTAIINSKFPNIGNLMLHRLVLRFKHSFRRSNKPLCISSGMFVAHLVNQCVVHEFFALEILMLLLDTPTNDSIEIAIVFLKECGMKLTQVSCKGIDDIFETLRTILHQGQLDHRVQNMIEMIFQIRKDGFKYHEAVMEELDLVKEKDQMTHTIVLNAVKSRQDKLIEFEFDRDYFANEDKYIQLSKEILDSYVSKSEGEEMESSAGPVDGDKVILDNTETNLTALRHTIDLTIDLSLDVEECAHKLMEMQLKPGQEIVLCHIILNSCIEMRTYFLFFGLLAGRFCATNKMYMKLFERIFQDSYYTIHRMDMNELCNVSKFFAHLLFTDSISWGVMSCIKLNEKDTTSSNMIFIKVLFQELSENMGLSRLNQRLKNVTLKQVFEGLFPKDNPKNMRFAKCFFTSIGLGNLTDDSREHLMSHSKLVAVPALTNEEVEDEEPTSSDESTSSSSSSSEEDERW